MSHTSASPVNAVAGLWASVPDQVKHLLVVALVAVLGLVAKDVPGWNLPLWESQSIAAGVTWLIAWATPLEDRFGLFQAPKP